MVLPTQISFGRRDLRNQGLTPGALRAGQFRRCLFATAICTNLLIGMFIVFPGKTPQTALPPPPGTVLPLLCSRLNPQTGDVFPTHRLRTILHFLRRVILTVLCKMNRKQADASIQLKIRLKDPGLALEKQFQRFADDPGIGKMTAHHKQNTVGLGARVEVSSVAKTGLLCLRI